MTQSNKRYILRCLLLGALAIVSFLRSSEAGAQQLYSYPDSMLQAEKLMAKSLNFTEDSLISAKAHHLLMAYELDSTNVAVLTDLSLVYSLLNRPADAISCAEKAYKLSGKDYFLGSGLMRMAMSLGNVELSQKVGEELLEKKPGDLDLLNDLASVYMAAKNVDKAIETLKKLNTEVGDNAELNYGVARVIADNLGESGFHEARTMLQDYVDSHPRDINGYLFLINFLQYYEKDFKGVLELIDSMPEEIKADARMRSAKIEQLIALEKFNVASKELLKLAKEEGSEPEMLQAVLEKIGSNPTLTSKKGFYAAFIPTLKKIADLYPHTPDFRFILANAYTQNGDTEKGEQLFEKMVEDEVEIVQPYFVVLKKFIQEEDIDSIIKYSEIARKIHPEVPDFYFYSVIGYINKEDNKKAFEIADEGLKRAQTGSAVYNNLMVVHADLLSEMGDKKGAIQGYEKAYVLMPNNPSLLNNYAYALATTGGDLDKAETLASDAVKLNSTESSYLDTYGWILYLKGKYDLAKIYLESAIRNGGEQSDTIMDHYGDVLIKLDLKEEAVDAWKKAIELGADAKVLNKKIKKATR